MPSRHRSRACPESLGSVEVDDFVAALVHPHKSAITFLREHIRQVDPRVREGVKWNAPSFHLSGQDHFLTFKLRPESRIQLVLHTGAKARADTITFEIPDPAVANNTVVQVVQAGYTIGERVLRPAMVGVAKGGPKAEVPAAAEPGTSGINEADA